MGGNWIVNNLLAALSFFNSMMTNVYDILTINPVTYRNGSVWHVVDSIYTALLGTGISLAVIFFFIGLIEDEGELIKHKHIGPVIWSFVKLILLSAVLIYGRYFLLFIFAIGKEFIDAVMIKSGMSAFEMSWVELPDGIINATNGLSMANGIIFWIVTLIAALVVMVTCFVIMLTVYGRLFMIYIHIAIAPIGLACFAGRQTMQHFLAFVKSFAGVCLEGVVIVVTCMIFAAFMNNSDGTITNGSGSAGSTVQTPEELQEDAQEAADNAVSGITGTSDRTDNAQRIWVYLGELCFLFALMASTIKGADDFIRRKLGL